jgi:hypothetical protein
MAAPGDERGAMRLLKRLATRAAGGGEDPALAADLLRRGLIERRGEGLVTTETGRARLRRHLSGADGFAEQHQTRSPIVIDDEEFGRRTVTVNHDESPLARLRRTKGRGGRPLIGPAEFTAGERLRADFTRGQLMPRVTANWSAAVADKRRDGGAGGMAELTHAVIAARQRVDRALVAIGPEFAGVLVDFCCFLKGIEEIEQSRSWPARSAKLVIRLALASLARHYGLSAVGEGAERAGRLRHWGSADYRPRIDGKDRRSETSG